MSFESHDRLPVRDNSVVSASVYVQSKVGIFTVDGKILGAMDIMNKPQLAAKN